MRSNYDFNMKNASTSNSLNFVLGIKKPPFILTGLRLGIKMSATTFRRFLRTTTVIVEFRLLWIPFSQSVRSPPHSRLEEQKMRSRQPDHHVSIELYPDDGLFSFSGLRFCDTRIVGVDQVQSL